MRILLIIALLCHTAPANAGCCKPGPAPCTACRDCTRCKYCAIDKKGSCSVCRDQTGPQTATREATRSKLAVPKK